jgi:hypothetical protein
LNGDSALGGRVDIGKLRPTGHRKIGRHACYSQPSPAADDHAYLPRADHASASPSATGLLSSVQLWLVFRAALGHGSLFGCGSGQHMS